jgi:eukaryotic-like serine/threonine-protein kinase
LAHLQFARAFSQAADKAAAKSQYGEFLQLWKNADGEVSIFKQARAEYASIIAALP